MRQETFYITSRRIENIIEVTNILIRTRHKYYI